jgi:hypothetical protein
MGNLAPKVISASLDDELFKLLGKELEERISVNRDSPEFVAEIQKLPIGLRAMAVTYELDVSLVMDDLGWHFGNWHNIVLAKETIRGLDELGATELAVIFKEAFQIALRYWDELGMKDWSKWYHDSPLEKEIKPLNEEAWNILEAKKNGIFEYWVNYARKYPERIANVN